MVAHAEDFLGDGFRVLKHVIVDCWPAQMVGFDQRRKDRAGQRSRTGDDLSALRQLTRFYDKLDRIERDGESPRYVFADGRNVHGPASGISRPQRGKSYLNLARGPVRLAEPWVYTPPS